MCNIVYAFMQLSQIFYAYLLVLLVYNKLSLDFGSSFWLVKIYEVKSHLCANKSYR